MSFDHMNIRISLKNRKNLCLPLTSVNTHAILRRLSLLQNIYETDSPAKKRAP